MRRVHVFALLMGLCLTGCLESGADREVTGRDGATARLGFNDALRSARVARIDASALNDRVGAGSRVTLALPELGPTELEVRTVRHLMPGVTTFTGRLADDDTSDFTLSVEDGRLTGTLHQGAQAWLVEPRPASDQSVVRTIDRRLVPQDEPSPGLAPALQRTAVQPGRPDQLAVTSAVSNGNVRVLFLYATDVGNANAQAANIVAAFNDSLSLSAVASNNFLSIAGVQPVASNFAGQNRSTIIGAMIGRAAPFASIDSDMTATGADLAFLLVSEDATASDVAGYGRVGGVAKLFDGNNAFGLSTQSYALGDRTALHEIGHILGGQHENVTTAGIARPVVAPDRTWMTVMGGYIDCPFNGLAATCVRLDRWSNPDQTYNGVPLGVVNERDMESHLEGSMPTASNWRGDPVPTSAAITTPPPGSTLPGATVSFAWTAGTGVSQYWLYVGNAPGGVDYYNASQGLGTSTTVSGLPTDGRLLYVRLWSSTSAGWQYSDYSYFAATVAAPATITSPTPGSSLTGASATFAWTTGSGVSQYYLYIGNSPGAADLYGANQGLATSATVSGLPTDGRTLYVRLWSLTSAGWQYRDYTYAAATVATPATLVSPTPGTTLPGASVTFYWTTGSGVSQYYLYVGSSSGSGDLYAQSQGNATAGTVSGLPTDGRTLYVRLWSYTAAGWQWRDYTYTAASTCSALNGQHGQIWMPVSANSQYVYRDGWCTVGHGLPQMCFQGTYFYYQNLQSSYCSAVGSSGTCYDNDAWWWVTCDALVDCIYNCAGQCVKADC